VGVHQRAVDRATGGTVKIKTLACGFTGMVKVSQFGVMLAYVALPKSHPYHGKHYDAIPSAPVHGGLTFAGEIDGFAEWAVGFDFGHWRDLVPAWTDDAMVTAPTSQLHPESAAWADLERLAEWLASGGAHVTRDGKVWQWRSN